jgi:hypothetical protein
MPEPIRLALCESEALVLRPYQLYIFEPLDGCKRCRELLAQHVSVFGEPTKI